MKHKVNFAKQKEVPKKKHLLQKIKKRESLFKNHFYEIKIY